MEMKSEIPNIKGFVQIYSFFPLNQYYAAGLGTRGSYVFFIVDLKDKGEIKFEYNLKPLQDCTRIVAKLDDEKVIFSDTGKLLIFNYEEMRIESEVPFKNESYISCLL